MINIYEDINKLQATFRKTDEFKHYKKRLKQYVQMKKRKHYLQISVMFK